jgi:hypothetical protein
METIMIPTQRQLQIEAVPHASESERTRPWRTRRDPFGKVWKHIRRQLQKNPDLAAKELFSNLQHQHPGKFGDGQLRTLQRRIKIWRATAAPRKEAPGKPEPPIWPVIADVQLKNPSQIAFLSAFEICCYVKAAARAARINAKTHYHWLKNDGAYGTAFGAARMVAVDVLESEVFRRAVLGVDEPIFYKGRICGTIRRYDDKLMKFLLRAWMPEKFGNQKLRIPAPANAPVQPKLEVVYRKSPDHPAEDDIPVSVSPEAAAAVPTPDNPPEVRRGLPWADNGHSRITEGSFRPSRFRSSPWS